MKVEKGALPNASQKPKIIMTCSLDSENSDEPLLFKMMGTVPMRSASTALVMTALGAINKIKSNAKCLFVIIAHSKFYIFVQLN
jgi:hypothetical protein